MLSRHEISLQRISWGMAAVAIVTATGLALTASGSRAAQQMAAISDTVETADFARLSNLVAKPAAATVPQTVDEWPETPAVPTAARIDTEMAAAPPPAPTAPIVPAADMVAPVPPMPPVPSVTVREEKNAITITHADGRIERHHIPTEAEIRRMVPRVDVRNGCEGDQTVSKRESVDSDGRRTIRIRICEAQIEAQAHRAARAGLVTARAQVARTAHMTDRIRAEVLRDLDEEIAKIDGQGD